MNEGSSKSLLPLVEILISIGIFAIAVVLTLQLFLLARFLGNKTADTAKAIFEVQNVAESIKSMKTDADMENYIINELNAGIVKNVEDNMHYDVYYDGDWNVTGSGDGAVYKLKIDMNKVKYDSGVLYNFILDFYKTEDYPFINNKNSDDTKDNIPLLVSVNASKFILN